MNFDMNVYQFLSLIAGLIAAAWAYDRWMLHRINTGDANVLQKAEENTKALHERISNAQNRMVPRHEFDREINRLHLELQGVHQEIVRNGERQVLATHEQTKRIDQVLLIIQKRKDD